ncbi:MAG: hypothetical protein PHD41_03080 [Methanosarcinaceae archaeon]|nr:hypothetical protein [Methanosarcinaceae archaeon]MDD4332381.1 hypothetical protein [Methanosarcinaceae archaeon]MDD4749081.1 hypothetical protein [Methanosarcinaceae archaeon]
MTQESARKIEVDLERNRVKIQIFHGEDKEVIKLKLGEAEALAEKLEKALEDFSRRKQVRID